MKFRSFLALAAVVAASACGSDEASDSAATMVPVTTVAPATTVLATTDVSTTAVATTAVSTTAIATTAVATTQLATTVPTTAAPTTTAAATTTAPSTAPCDLDTIVRQTDTAYDGVTAITLRCAGDWASWLGQPDDETAADGFFAVAQWNGSTWELANLGTAGICGDGGVPPELWDALGCVE